MFLVHKCQLSLTPNVWSQLLVIFFQQIIENFRRVRFLGPGSQHLLDSCVVVVLLAVLHCFRAKTKKKIKGQKARRLITSQQLGGKFSLNKK